MRNGFDAEFEVKNIIDDIRHYFATNGNKDTGESRYNGRRIEKVEGVGI